MKHLADDDDVDLTMLLRTTVFKDFIYNLARKEKTVCELEGVNYFNTIVSINVVVTAEIERQPDTAGLL